MKNPRAGAPVKGVPLMRECAARPAKCAYPRYLAKCARTARLTEPTLARLTVPTPPGKIFRVLSDHSTHFAQPATPTPPGKMFRALSGQWHPILPCQMFRVRFTRPYAGAGAGSPKKYPQKTKKISKMPLTFRPKILIVRV